MNKELHARYVHTNLIAQDWQVLAAGQSTSFWSESSQDQTMNLKATISKTHLFSLEYPVIAFNGIPVQFVRLLL